MIMIKPLLMALFLGEGMLGGTNHNPFEKIWAGCFFCLHDDGFHIFCLINSSRNRSFGFHGLKNGVFSNTAEKSREWF